ncbi:MAG TPA: T9SS type A sorting domain-containing protein [Flavobacterium sp.]|nr:T9SS type A sorting domain-containing protein [Flavobacterium sp.]HRZ74416.1 T9SS type A sorting domain-containing protein [Flavobacterium sp.]
MKKIVMLIGLFSVSCFAQAPGIQWQKSFGGSGEDFAKAIVQTSDGGYVFGGDTNSSDGDVVGYPWSYSVTRRDYWIVKTDAEGNIAWQKVYGGFYNDLLTSINSTSDGGYIVSGYSESSDGTVLGHIGNYDYWLLKLNALGEIEWQKTLGGTNEDYATGIIQTTDGGYITIGHTKSTNGGVSGNHGFFDVWIVKLSSAGAIEWRKAYGGSADDKISDAYGNRAIIQTLDGGYIFTAKTKSSNGDVTTNQGLSDAWVVKINNLGTIEWQKTFGGASDDFAHSVIQTNDGNYVITAGSASTTGDFPTNYGATDLWVIKINPTGAVLWQSKFGGTNSESYQYSSVIETNDNGLLVCSYTTSTNIDATGNHSFGSPDAWLVKLNSAGVKQWHRCFGGRNWDEGHQILQTADEGYMIAGYNSNHNDPSGADWTFNHGTYDAWLIKLNPETLSQPDFTAPDEQLLVYPNPSRKLLYLKAPEQVEINKIIITDVSGKECLVKTNQLSVLEIEQLSAGIYFIQAFSNKGVFNTKFIKE